MRKQPNPSKRNLFEYDQTDGDPLTCTSSNPCQKSCTRQQRSTLLQHWVTLIEKISIFYNLIRDKFMLERL